MGARSRRFSSLASGSSKATAVISCAVVLLAGCGGSGASTSEAGAPVIRGDVAAPSSLTVSGTPATAAVGTTITLTSAGGTGTDAVSYATTGTICRVSGTSLTATAPGTCAVTATQGTQTATATFTFTAATSAASRRVVFYNLAASSPGPNRSYDQTASAPTALIRNAFVNPGSSFLGWNTTNDGRGVWYADGAEFPFTSDTELFPIWGKPGQPYKITAAKEGEASASVTFLAAPNLDGTPAQGMDYVLSAVRLRGGQVADTKTVSGPGTYVFNLKADPAYIFQVRFGGQTFGADNTIEVKATVTFNANGGSGEMETQAASTTTPLRAMAFTRPGYVFGGWGMTAALLQIPGNCCIGDGWDYPFKESVTLYARWFVADSATVTFNANGGTGTMTDQAAGGETPLKANEFTKTGYAFDGWATTSNGSKAYANGDKYKFAKSATLYARWLPTVTFNANGGTGTMADQAAGGETPLKANEFTKTGYAFDGWAKTATGSKEYANEQAYPFTSSAVLYARWCKPFTVTVSARRIGANVRSVQFSANSELPMTSFTVTTKFGTFPQTVTTTSNSGSYAYTDLPKDKTYKFIVTGTNAAGCSFAGETESAV